MSIIVCDGVSVSYGADVILDKIDFSVNEGDKVGVIGVNGAGKSTLFAVIRGLLEASKGDVYITADAEIGCLEQINDAHRFNCNIYETALSAFDKLIKLENEINDLRIRIEAGDESVIKAFSDNTERFNLLGGNECRSKTKSMLAKFGFEESDLTKSADELSGGQKTKLLLVKLLLSEPDIMLLDEPTNHLDYKTCEWLENYIISSKKTFLIISHDRYFLDKITNKTLEISHGVSEMYDGNYTTFREKKKALDEAKLKHYNLQQKEIARLEAFIENQRKWNREKNIIAAESRQKTIDKMVKLEKPKEKEKGIKFSISHSGAMSNDVLSVRNLSMSYPNKPLFENLSFEIKRGEHLFIIGKNGCGKSTLIKILTGREKQIGGVFELGYNQTIGYYDQEQQLLDQNSTVIDELWNVYSDKTNTEIRAMLASFGFRGDDVFKSVSVLSGGERARLSIAKMVACGVSLLILDEPTNHLDIDSREMLESALNEYDGTIITVSHDRYFIKNLATAILEIDKDGFDSGYNWKHCTYEDYIEKCTKKETVVSKQISGAGKADFEEAKQRKNQYRSAKTRYEKAEKEISDLENQLAELRSKSTDESIISDYVALDEIYRQETECEAKIDNLYAELEKLEEIISSYDE
ncbi:MAG: ABC-F family ATP-binding cassette domain-containing protein [Ruminococcaceae bacterium]|nr:ABC-F family ATP-binding cassette domain-containing protein [Oscillospiraceae bacterium]